ncbi:hypothetical protein KIN20_034628 [Parelaphostrongylus tenuis]|uniref:Uncharacterized protein n=1 Tax=Parelaphostrongylus tenuis TaxID=148309 RepID=A0AAD5RAA2_PARTN|nr:hypothetical protein KIN20_034628 [Parelaphostrongylus tenuis]
MKDTRILTPSQNDKSGILAAQRIEGRALAREEIIRRSCADFARQLIALQYMHPQPSDVNLMYHYGQN